MEPTPNGKRRSESAGRRNDRKRNKIRMNDWLEVILALLKDGIAVRIDIQIRSENPDNLHDVTCEYCGWHTVKTSKNAGQRALRAHHQHCTAYAQQVQWIAHSDDQE